MSRSKYPRHDRYLEYLQVPHLSLDEYLRQRLGIGTNKALPGNAKKATSTRHKRREEHYEAVYKKMQEDLKKDQIKNRKPPLEKLRGIHQKIIDASETAMTLMEFAGEYKANDVKKYREIIKTELGEPTTITKNENINEDKVKSIDNLYDEPTQE